MTARTIPQLIAEYERRLAEDQANAITYKIKCKYLAHTYRVRALAMERVIEDLKAATDKEQS